MKKLFDKINKDHLFWVLLILYIIILCSLAYFRDVVNDDALYFKETFLISELFANGKWIGAYGVGLHGFISKIPPALVFLFTGPSVTVVTLYHIVLTAVIGFLAYKLFSYVLKNKLFGIFASALLFTNFHFVLSAVTYYREIPSILVVLLLLNNVIRNRNKYFLSFLFLLLLDTKEYIFFVFALGYIIWLFIDSEKESFFAKVWDVIKRSLLIFLPSIVWTVAMFTTNVIPVNMFLASIIGLKDNAFRYLTQHFETTTSTFNALEGGRNIFQIVINENWSPIVRGICNVVNIILSYIGKILYPRVFSFLSVPKVVILPVVFSSVLILKKYFKKKKKSIKNLTILSLIIILWLIVYLLRASHGRYLLPIVPPISVMYIYLVFKQKLSRKQKLAIVLATFLYISAGLLFETTYILPKAILEYSIFATFSFILYRPKLKTLKYFLVAMISVASLGTALLFSYVQGQVYGFVNFGRNRRAKEIAEMIPEEQKYWTNSYKNLNLISALNEERYLDPEWKWKLNDVVPIREDLKALGEEQAYSFPIFDLEEFHNSISFYNIDLLILVTTEEESDNFPNQEYLEDFQKAEWLDLDKKVDYTNMTIYIFTVKK
jgi:hypothetical protein